MKQETDHSWLIIKALEDRAEQAEAKLREIAEIAEAGRPTYDYPRALKSIATIARSTSQGGEG